MDKSVTLSIMIVSWNTRDLLRDCLRSVYETTHNLNFEVFVVDNASSDGSPEMVEKEFSQVKLIKNNTNFGDGRANNQAIKISKGDFILLLNSDVIVLNNCIEKMLCLMRENSMIGTLTCSEINPDGTIRYPCRRFPTITTTLYDDTFLGRWFPKNRVIKRYRYKEWAHNDFREVEQPPITCFMIRRQIINIVGLLDENLFIFFNDVDWCLQMKKAGFKIFYTPEARVIHYGSASLAVSSDIYQHWHKDRFYYYRKHYGLYSVIVIKFILILDFFERMGKLLIKRSLGWIETKEILNDIQNFWKMIRN